MLIIFCIFKTERTGFLIDKYKAYVIRQCYYFPVSNANSGGWQNINIGHSGVWKVYVNYFAQFHVFHMYIDLIIVDLLI